MWLGSCIAVAVTVAKAGSCGSDLPPSLGISMCHRYGLKKTKKKKKKKSTKNSNSNKKVKLKLNPSEKSHTPDSLKGTTLYYLLYSFS